MHLFLQLDHLDRNGQCALVHAALRGHMEVVKFLLQSDWGAGGKQSQLQSPSPTQLQSQPSSPEQAQSEVEQEDTPEEEERESEISLEQPEAKEESQQELQEPQVPQPPQTQTQPQAQAQPQPQPPHAFSKSHAVQQALVAAASMGYIEVNMASLLFTALSATELFYTNITRIKGLKDAYFLVFVFFKFLSLPCFILLSFSSVDFLYFLLPFFHFYSQIVSYLLDLPEKDEEETERAQINNYDSLWGETGRVRVTAESHT